MPPATLATRTPINTGPDTRVQATGFNEPTLWLYDPGTCELGVGHSCTRDTTSSDPVSLGPVGAG